MRRVIFLFFLSAVFGGIVLLHVQAKSSGPKISSELYNFGEARAGAIIKHTFRIRNMGDAPAFIRSAHPDCSCVTNTAAPKQIDSGATAEITIEVHLGSESPSMGSSLLLMFTNHNPIKLTVVGRVIADLPEDVDLGTFHSWEGAKRTLCFKPVVGKNIVIKDIAYDSRFIKCVLNPNPDNTTFTDIKIATVNGLVPGPFTTHLRVSLAGDVDEPRLIRIHGVVKDVFEVVPKSLAFDNDEISNKIWKNIKIRNALKTPFILGAISSDPPNSIEYKVMEALNEDTSRQIEIRIADKGVRPQARVTVTFEIRIDNSVRVLSVPLFIAPR